jgi:hypothetical protein
MVSAGVMRVAEGDDVATNGGGDATGGGGAEPHCTRTAAAIVSVRMRQAWTREESSPLDRI